MKVALGADHAGFALKEALKDTLASLGIEHRDLGTSSAASVDYPDFARAVADEVAAGHADRGILVCGTGTGMAMAANKVPGVRAAVAHNVDIARLCREHNDANVLALGARQTPLDEASAIVVSFCTTDFDGGRHLRRVEKIQDLDLLRTP